MMEDPRDFDHRTRIDAQGYPVGPRPDSGYVPAILLGALLLIGGYFVVTSGGDKVQTASNQPAAERSAPPVMPTPPKQ
jgi:hypothetical protein